MINRQVQPAIHGLQNENAKDMHFVAALISNLKWICLVVVIGTIGFSLIEGWSISDSLYMTVITVSTVGYGETNEVSAIGRVFTSTLIFISIVVMTIWTAQITTSFVSGELSGRFARRRIREMIDSLTDHVIIFGSGTMAITCMNQLKREGTDCVIVDDHAEQLKGIRSRHPSALVVESNPKDELALSDANIFAAKYVVATLESDFDNLLILMTVKELDPNIKVIARANDPLVASRMIKTGVDHVICPFQLCGEHIVDLVINDEVEDESKSYV